MFTFKTQILSLVSCLLHKYFLQAQNDTGQMATSHGCACMQSEHYGRAPARGGRELKRDLPAAFRAVQGSILQCQLACAHLFKMQQSQGLTRL